MLDSPSSDPDVLRKTPTAAPTQIGLKPQARLTDSELKSVEQFAAQRETAMLAIMFIDIEGFTRLTERRGDAYAISILESHNRLLTDIIENERRGQLIKTIGDGMLAVFSEPSVAVERAIRIQLALQERNQQRPDEPIKVRIGVHMGQVTVEGGVQPDIIGGHVNRAARVESLAKGAHIFVTQAIYENARGFVHIASGREIEWKSHGRFLIRGIDEPVDIYEVGVKGDIEFVPPAPGPNCQPLRTHALTRAQRIRYISFIVFLLLASAVIIIASLRFRLSRKQSDALDAMIAVLGAADLSVAPPIEDQKKLLTLVAFEEGNAALDYIRIPTIRASERPSAMPRLIEERKDELEPKSEWGQMAKLAGVLILSKVHSRLTVAANQTLRGQISDASQPLIPDKEIKLPSPLPSPDSSSLDALETGAKKTTCEFYPQIFSIPRYVSELPVFNLETIGIAHRAMIARALIYEKRGDSAAAAQSLQHLLRFNFHISQSINSYEELHYLMRYRRHTLLALVDVYKRNGKSDEAARWTYFLSSQFAVSREMEQAYNVLFDRGYKEAQIGVRAAALLVERCPDPFWQIQAGLSLGLTRAQPLNYFDRSFSVANLDKAISQASSNPRLAGLLRVFKELKSGVYPPDLSFITLMQ